MSSKTGRYELLQSKTVLGRSVYHKGDVFDIDLQTGGMLVAGGIAKKVADTTKLTVKTDAQRKAAAVQKAQAAKDKETAATAKTAQEKNAADKAAVDKANASKEGEKASEEGKESKLTEQQRKDQNAASQKAATADKVKSTAKPADPKTAAETGDPHRVGAVRMPTTPNEG